jgi:hypothetical protein
MYFDKESGDLKYIKKEVIKEKEKKLITNYNDFYKEREAIYTDLGLDPKTGKLLENI